jgi:hypothetical protein
MTLFTREKGNAGKDLMKEHAPVVVSSILPHPDFDQVTILAGNKPS